SENPEKKTDGTIHWHPRPLDHAGVGLHLLDQPPRHSLEDGGLGVGLAIRLCRICVANRCGAAGLSERRECGEPPAQLCFRRIAVCFRRPGEAELPPWLLFRISSVADGYFHLRILRGALS